MVAACINCGGLRISQPCHPRAEFADGTLPHWFSEDDKIAATFSELDERIALLEQGRTPYIEQAPAKRQRRKGGIPQ